jgi:cysteine-rich secretory family protein
MKYCSIYLTVSFLMLCASIGLVSAQDIEPTDEEQYMLELINRARMNPPAEGEILANHPNQNIQFAYDFFNVDRQTIIDDFASYMPVPPLAFNDSLIRAARRHTKDMKDNNFQDHPGTDDTTPGDRIEEAGYEWWTYGENVYAYAESVDHAHAGFVVDWGVASLGHRKNTLEYADEPRWMEIGIGILRTGSAKLLAAKRLRRDVHISAGNTTTADQVGPMLVTIDFAAPFQYSPQVLGVVYQDLNENLAYDIGEGLGGVTINVQDSNKSTATYSSGGYSIPFSLSGEYKLIATGGLLEETIEKTFTIGLDNVKVDFRLGEGTDISDWALFD